ncbi:MAG: DnaA/Hda family protein [Chitinophagaceae bacterium]|nr:DnaA/Hda family protein [Chitinophagaceae bacterium]
MQIFISNETEKFITFLESIKKRISPQEYRAWFAPVTFIKLENNVLTIECTHIIYDHWETNYIDIITEGLEKTFGKDYSISYFIKPDENEIKSIVKETKLFYNKPNAEEEESKHLVFNPYSFKNSIDQYYTFDTFIESSNNRFALLECNKIIEKVFKKMSNDIVFLYGSTGLGKTHLAHSMVNKLTSLDTDKKVRYISSEMFTRFFANAAKNKYINEFQEYFMSLDLFIVDDVHLWRIPQFEKTIEIFFQIFNFLKESRKQIVLIADTPPSDLVFPNRILSRFRSGLTIEIEPLNTEAKKSYIKSFIKNKNTPIHEHVINYLSEQPIDNIRDLNGIIVTLYQYSEYLQKDIDIEMTENIYKKKLPKIEKKNEFMLKPITIEIIQQMVANQFNISLDDMKSLDRRRSITTPRYIAMDLCRNNTRNSVVEIGKAFNKDHTTVVAAQKNIKNLLSGKDNGEKIFRDGYLMIEEKIKQIIENSNKKSK